MMSDGQLGLVLLSMAAGSVLALPVAGWLVGRLGSRVTMAAAGIALCLALPLPVASPSVALLSVSLALLGACNGLLDVSMNTQAADVEQRVGRPIMSAFHALFSLGGATGALLAGGAMAVGVGDMAHVAVSTVVALSATVVALPGLARPRPAREHAGPSVARPSGTLLTLGILALLGLLAEGAMADWGAVYLHDTLGSSPSVAALGFAAFSLAMAAGRFSGDAMVGRLGPRRVLRGSSAVAAVGLGAALLVGQPAVGVVGCALVGLGIANIIPVLFSSAARVPGVPPGRALAAVATTGYLGFSGRAAAHRRRGRGGGSRCGAGPGERRLRVRRAEGGRAPGGLHPENLRDGGRAQHSRVGGPRSGLVSCRAQRGGKKGVARAYGTEQRARNLGATGESSRVRHRNLEDARAAHRRLDHHLDWPPECPVLHVEALQQIHADGP